ncbi:hypothetical protein BM528_17570 [Alteromonas sp. RW2A1]|jgi:hypothetical protein|uniref:hypothetical protein n=1 Tax=Alteromonas sp. RW2A1 TaxID=1917158 RepID=UPI0009041CC6|nr:hypothetical protein [Alteromonas sp. RW2A1]APE07364.1 hypothetical protein BM528_17570 [Alteromonas sp. RW2A1]
MSEVSAVSLNSAFAAGQMGLQRASDGVTQAAANIADRNNRDKSAQADIQSASADGAAKSQPNSNLTSDLISLNVNSLNAQASAKVIDVANDTLGTIIDTLA